MPGLELENIMIEVTDKGHLILKGELHGILKDVKEYIYLAIFCGENQHGINSCHRKTGETEARSI